MPECVAIGDIRAKLWTLTRGTGIYRIPALYVAPAIGTLARHFERPTKKS